MEFGSSFCGIAAFPGPPGRMGGFRGWVGDFGSSEFKTAHPFLLAPGGGGGPHAVLEFAGASRGGQFPFLEFLGRFWLGGAGPPKVFFSNWMGGKGLGGRPF